MLTPVFEIPGLEMLLPCSASQHPAGEANAEAAENNSTGDGNSRDLHVVYGH